MGHEFIMINYTTLGGFYTLFAVFGTITNIGVIVTILKNPKLRTSGMYFPVIMLAVVDFLTSIFICSIAAYRYLSLSGVSCNLSLATAYMSYIFEAITMYGMVLLYVNHIMHIKTPNETRQKHCGVAWTIVVLLGCTVIFAVTINFLSNFKSCILTLTRSSVIGLSVGVYFLPLAVLCLGGLIMIVLHSSNNGRQPTIMNSNSMPTSQQARFPAHLIVAGFIISFTVGPSYILSCLNVYNAGSWYINMVIGFSMFSSSKSCILPFVWLLDSHYRFSMSSMFGKSNNIANTSTTMMAYNNYSAYPQQISYGPPQNFQGAPQNAYGRPQVQYGTANTEYVNFQNVYGNPQIGHGNDQGYGTPQTENGPQSGLNGQNDLPNKSFENSG
ncbi:hypothetical protein LOTGIDRAFT_158442 [Lottia gigantea]|uniref:G-protein coupled receptors family 1 profile domain-containing protein n=1 Tax=Lottia gigantea TaxID=225164 RepID=V4AWI5_LOTGI|nr:hypothetical protein LOTGIDRAFT_158442 [Lottia gigantea]ESO99355.1 hypothetical protein LOTGIDRAFT_158442 [Lottia gigantea]